VTVTSVSNQGTVWGDDIPPKKTDPGGPGGPDMPTIIPVVPTPIEIQATPAIADFHERDIDDGPAPLAQVTVQNVGTTTLSIGTIRLGALTVFSLEGGQEVPPAATEKSGMGVAILNQAHTALDVSVLHNIDIHAPTYARIHKAAAGSNGSGIYLFGNPANPIRASWSIPVASVADLLAGDLYVNIKTPQFPNGQIRGQITPTDAESSEFRIVSDTGQAVLAPGQIRQLEIEFDPATVGPKTTSLSIFSNDTDQPLLDVPVQGVGAQYQGAPIMTGYQDNKNASLTISWVNPNETPWAFLSLAYDMYYNEWIQFTQFNSEFHWSGGTATTDTLPLTFSGGYHFWTSTLYPDMNWFISPNPGTGISYGGVPHQPLDVAVEDRGGGHVRLTWKPEVYGTWHNQIIVFKEGEGFIPVGSPCYQYPEFSPWTFIDYPEYAYDHSQASFFNGWADFTLPGAGDYTFFIRGVGWLPPYLLGEFATGHITLN